MTNGIKYILWATFFFMLMNAGVKYINDIPAHEVVFFRAWVSLVVCYFMLRKKKLSPWGNNKKYLFLRGASGTVALVMYFYTLQNMPLATAVTIQYLSPLFTVIIAGFMLKEYAKPVQWLFFLMAFAGVLLLKGFDARVSIFYLVLGITAAVFSGIAYNFVRKLKDFDDPLVVVFYFPLITVPAVGSYTMTHWVAPSLMDWGILVAIGLSVTFAQIFMTKAYQLEKAANIMIFNYLGIIYAIILGYIFFDEIVTIPGYLGIALILTSVILSSRYGKKTAKE